MKPKSADKLYAQSRKLVDAFQFDEQVTQVFSDMISRSVPGYHMMLDLLAVLTEQTVTANSRCYDLGSSLGASTLAIRQNITVENCQVIAVDNSLPMIESCQRLLDRDASKTPVELIHKNIQNIDFQPCKLVSLNLTLQFIALEERLPLLKKIARQVEPGGALFLSEKICFDDNEQQQRLTELHHQFKKHQGYSDLEIAQKRSAIDNVLIPESLKTHQQRLLDAGFSKVIIALQCLNFVTLIAYK